MHYLIRVIVKAENSEEAVEKADSFMGDLVERGEYDWYDLDGRWGKSVGHPISSEKGKELIDEGMKYTRENFDRSMAAIRYMLENYSDDEIFEEKFDKENAPSEFYLSRYQFNCAYGSGSGNAYVYGSDDVWGSAIDNQKDLARVMQDEDAKDFWVVAVDAHN